MCSTRDTDELLETFRVDDDDDDPIEASCLTARRHCWYRAFAHIVQEIAKNIEGPAKKGSKFLQSTVVSGGSFRRAQEARASEVAFLLEGSGSTAPQGPLASTRVQSCARRGLRWRLHPAAEARPIRAAPQHRS